MKSELVVKVGLGVSVRRSTMAVRQQYQVWDGTSIWSFAYTEAEARADAARHYARKQEMAEEVA